MKFIFWICLMLNAKMLYSQNRIFKEAADLSNSISQKKINKIKIPFGKLGRNVHVIYNDGTSVDFRKKNIWGCETANKEILRFYDGDIYVLVDTIGVNIYKTWARFPVYYFSENMNSDVKLFRKKKVMKFLGKTKFELLCKQSPLVQRLSEYY